MSLAAGRRVWVWHEGNWRQADIEGYSDQGEVAALRLIVGDRMIYIGSRTLDTHVRIKHPKNPPLEP